MLLRDQAILVTGASQGIGADIAAACLREGAYVAAVSRGLPQWAEAFAEKERLLCIQADLARASDCDRAVDEALARFGRLDGLVNNAAIFPTVSLLDSSADLLDSVYALNVRAPFLLCRRAVETMMSAGGGSIVNVGSTHAQAGSPLLAAYAVSKGALHTLTLHIAHNYAQYRVRANWITVGWVLTEGEVQTQRGLGRTDEQIQSMAEQYIPQGRYQTGAEIASAAVFLLSESASSHTGTEMRITGGFMPGFGYKKPSDQT